MSMETGNTTDLMSGLTLWGQALADRYPTPTGFAWETIRFSDKREVPFWLLRDSLYGSFEPLQEPCPLLQDTRERARVIAKIVERELVTHDQAEKRLSHKPERQMLVVAGAGRLAIATEHSHDKGQKLTTVTTNQLPLEAIVDNEAASDGYTGQAMLGDFMSDLEQYRLYTAATPANPAETVLSRLRSLIGHRA
jgi:hypothetical protein